MPALMEITLTSTYANQIMINRWNYVANGTPAAVSYSFALASAFGAIYDPDGVPPGYPATAPLRGVFALLTNAVQAQGIEVRNVYSVTDFYTTGFGQPLVGGYVAQGLSPAVAVGFRTNRVRADVRRATKRFSGIPEPVNAEGGSFEASYLGDMNSVAARLSEILQYDDEGNTLTFSPAVVKKQKYVVPGSIPARYAYRYIPADEGGEAAQLADTVTGVLFEPYNRMRTQTSRQYGRGI